MNWRAPEASIVFLPEVQRLLAILGGAEHKTRIVGGAVRNLILNIPVHDIDFATELPPSAVIARCTDAGIRTIPTGLEHGTVTALMDGRTFEITTLRQDVETTGRHAVVKFGSDWVADAQRRDFTINALYLHADGTLFDPLGGFEDVLVRHVQFIGDANARIREDYLRILRYFRFVAMFGTQHNTSQILYSIAANIHGLHQLSVERVWSELKKILTCSSPQVMHDMMAVGVFNVLGLGVMHRHCEKRSDDLGTLFLHFIWLEEDARRIADRLKLSNSERKTLVLWAQHVLHLQAAPSIQQARELLYCVGQDHYIHILCLAAARWHWKLKDDLMSIPTTHPIPPKPFSAEQFMQQGLSGAALGAALKQAEAEWVQGGF